MSFSKAMIGFLTVFLLLVSGALAQTVTVNIPVVITGVVALEGAQPLPEPVRVTMVCRNRVMTASTMGSRELGPESTPETDGQDVRESVLTSISGDFVFHFFVTRNVEARFQYASQTVDLTGCELTASLPGYRSDTVHLGIRHREDSPDVGLLVLHPWERPDSPLVSVTSLNAPKSAQRAYDEAANDLMRDTPNVAEARKHLERAIELYPEYAVAWHLLGRVHLAQNDEAGARHAFEKAMEVDPKYVSPYLSLSNMALMRNDWTTVADLSSKALEVDATLTKAQYFQALSRYSLGDLDTAEEWAMKIRESGEIASYPVTHYVLGAIRAKQGNVLAAAVEFREFLELRPEGRMADEAREQLQKWESSGLIAAPEG